MDDFDIIRRALVKGPNLKAARDALDRIQDQLRRATGQARKVKMMLSGSGKARRGGCC